MEVKSLSGSVVSDVKEGQDNLVKVEIRQSISSNGTCNNRRSIWDT